MSSSSSSQNPTFPPNFNYAKALEIHSVIFAVVFAALYVPLAIWFIHQLTSNRNRAYVVLTIFCCLRIAAFSIRAALAGIESAGEDLNLVITEVILVGVGYSSLLFSAYTLVLDLDYISNNPPPTNPILALIRRRRLFHLILVVGVALGITSAVGKNGQDPSKSNTLHVISVLIFLVLTVLQAYQTAVLTRNHYNQGSRYESNKHKRVGRRHATLILLLISFSLLVREVFTTVTISNPRMQNTEHFWYPLLAIPEIVAVILYSAPGLVPSREELDQNKNQSQFGANANGMQGAQYWNQSEHYALANAQGGNYNHGRTRSEGGDNGPFDRGGAPAW